MHYWAKVVRRAFADARKALGHSWLKTGSAIVVVAIGAALFALFEGGEEGWKKVLWFLCSSAGGGLFIFLAIFFLSVLNNLVVRDARRRAFANVRRPSAWRWYGVSD
jgi:hypothetical protein